MHELRLRPATPEELAYLTDWVKPGCLLSLLFHKNPDDPFLRLVNADLAAGETELLDFTAVRCAKGFDGRYFVLDGGDGWFLFLDHHPLIDAGYVEGDAPPPPTDPAGEAFPSRVELTRAPRSGLVHAARLHTARECPVDRVLRFDPDGRFESLLLRSSWDRLEQDLSSAPDAGPAGSAPQRLNGARFFFPLLPSCFTARYAIVSVFTTRLN
jgi:hypothetical protein